jgi:polyhydroxyalkanoate synthesis repressor PhaR
MARTPRIGVVLTLKASRMPTPRRAKAAEPPATEPTDAAPAQVRTLKKYPNRRLYDTQASSYITLTDVKRMVLASEPFEVRDAKTGEDLTRSILLQIILEEESGGVPMFSSQALAQIIRFYGHAMQGVMGTMLEKNLQAFTDLQAQFLQQSAGLYDPKQLSPELWTQFLSGQPAALQGLIGSYVEQSKSLFEQMQKASALFPGVAGFPVKR